MFQVPDLLYTYDALEPAISGDIMELHHGKHHPAYVNKLNEAVRKYPETQGRSVEELLGNLESVPDAIRTTVRNNGGGHYNHSLFWLCMSPQGGGNPEGALYHAITTRYGSYDAFVEEFTTKALSVFGSGWAWLMPNMDIITTPNQDSPLMQGVVAGASGQEPILALDVWEHAYYLDYKNDRADYIAKWWSIVDWQFVAERFSQSAE